MIRVLRSFVFLFVALSVLALALPARAQTVPDCQTTISALAEATTNAKFIGKNAEKDRAGLVGKLDSAKNKLNEGKAADAVQALTQFGDKVDALDDQGKIDPNDARSLIAGADEATACIQSLPV